MEDERLTGILEVLKLIAVCIFMVPELVYKEIVSFVETAPPADVQEVVAE